jgi:DNA-binding transcriptional MocR family regulator
MGRPQAFPGVRARRQHAAAQILGVNQSTVQRRIAELGDRAGRRLVERHLNARGWRTTGPQESRFLSSDYS